MTDAERIATTLKWGLSTGLRQRIVNLYHVAVSEGTHPEQLARTRAGIEQAVETYRVLSQEVEAIAKRL